MPLQLITKGTEVKLMETLNGIHEPAGWQAIHFHLGDLLDQYKSEYQVKIAINLIHDLLKEYDGGVFLLLDSSIIVLCYGVDKTLRNKLVFQLRYLYMDDPLAYTEEGSENPGFATAYDLKYNWQDFRDICTRRMAVSLRKGPSIERAEKESAKTANPAESGKAGGKAGFSASRLANIERDLTHADLHRVIRQQPVCAVLPGIPARRVFDELYIHIAHLRQILKSDVDFLSNRWLFKYLTQILDQRMMELIRTNPGRYLDRPVSINLNVETLLSSWFEEFDAVIDAASKVSIVIEVPVVDIFADMEAFTVARQLVQKSGYRVCLDGLTTESFAMIDRELLGLDLLKVQWNADVKNDLETAQNRELVRAVQRVGSNRVILCRCDNQQAVEYGQALGISLFQGRHIDGILNPAIKSEN